MQDAGDEKAGWAVTTSADIFETIELLDLLPRLPQGPTTAILAEYLPAENRRIILDVLRSIEYLTQDVPHLEVVGPSGDGPARCAHPPARSGLNLEVVS